VPPGVAGHSEQCINCGETLNTPDYLVIGHVTRDLLPGGGYRIGGTATFAAKTAQALGYSVGVLTSASDDLPLAEALDGMALRVVPAEHSTTFENIYYDGHRRQYLRSVAAPLKPEHVPAEWRGARIVHLGPLVQEVGLEMVDLFAAQTFIGVTPQGWLRRWDETGRVGPCAWAGAERYLARAAAVVLSLEDVGGDQAELERYIGLARLAAVTRSWQGATLFRQGQALDLAAYNVPEVDPTGAGDVFAAAFFLRLSETGDPEEAARFANAAASYSVQGEGYAAIASRAQVEERLRNGVLRDA